MKQVPYWHDTATPFARRSAGPVEGEVDVAVIGGGFTGLSAALALGQRGAPCGGAGGGPGRRGGIRAQRRARQQRHGDRFRRTRRAAGRWIRPAPSITPTTTPWIRWSASCGSSRSPAISAAAARSSSRPSRRITRRSRAASSCCTGRPIRIPIWFRAASIRDEVGSDRFHGGLLYRKSAQMHMGRFGAGLADGGGAPRRRASTRMPPVTGLKRLSRRAHTRSRRRGAA